jgi:hypothetical protein
MDSWIRRCPELEQAIPLEEKAYVKRFCIAQLSTSYPQSGVDQFGRLPNEGFATKGHETACHGNENPDLKSE